MNQHPKAVEMGKDYGFRRKEPGHQSPECIAKLQDKQGKPAKLACPFCKLLAVLTRSEAAQAEG